MLCLCRRLLAVVQRTDPHGTRMCSKAERGHGFALEPLSTLGNSRLQQQHPELDQSLTRFDVAQALGAVWALDLRTQAMLGGDRGERDRFITINKLKNISLHSRYPSANCVTTHVVLPHPSFSFSSLLLSPPYLWLGNTPPEIRTDGFPSPSDTAAPRETPAARPGAGGKVWFGCVCPAKERENEIPAKRDRQPRKR